MLKTVIFESHNSESI